MSTSSARGSYRRAMTSAPCRVGPFADGSGSGTSVGAARHVAGWRDMLREHFVALDVADPATDGPFTSEVRSTLLGHVSAAEVRSSRQSCVRTAALARDGDAYLQVGLLAQGRAVVEQDGRQAVLGPGRFVVYETDRPFAWHFPGAWRLLVLTWPRHLVDLDPGDTRAATARVLGADRLGRIVERTLTEAVMAPPDLAAERRKLAGELAALVEMTLPTDRGGASARGAAAVRRQVASYVAEHIEEPGLTVETIARAQFVSTRGLHRAFADVDVTVGSLIRRLRLQRARQRLLDPRDDHLSLTDIALACGFADLPTFSHGFKQAYQEAPSTYRRRARHRELSSG